MTSNSDLAEHDGTAGQEGKGPAALTLEEQLRREKQRSASYKASKDNLSRLYGEQCKALRASRRCPDCDGPVEITCASEVCIDTAIGNATPQEAPPAAPSAVLEGKDPGEPHPPSVSAEERARRFLLDPTAGVPFATLHGTLTTQIRAAESAAYALGLERARQACIDEAIDPSGPTLNSFTDGCFACVERIRAIAVSAARSDATSKP